MPAAHGVGALTPGTQKNPSQHRSEPVMVTAGKTVCEMLTVYEPVPPLVAAPSAVMVVPAVTPDPEMAMPTTSAPDVTAVTVSVVELAGMLPVKEAVGKDGETPSPAGQ